jgi:hypothetical protein
MSRVVDSGIVVEDGIYQQRVREYEFYQFILDLVDIHPNFILPENQLTKH